MRDRQRRETLTQVQAGRALEKGGHTVRAGAQPLVIEESVVSSLDFGGERHAADGAALRYLHSAACHSFVTEPLKTTVKHRKIWKP